MINQKLEQKQIKVSLLLEKPIPAEAKEIKKNLFDKFGIKNETSEFLNKKILEEKRATGKSLIENKIQDLFFLNKVIVYKDIHKIAQDHNLFITGLHKYKKVIPEENLKELNDFTEFLKERKHNDVLQSLGFIRNNSFAFEQRTSSINNLGFDEMFFVIAPKSHLIKSKKDITIGHEISSGHGVTIPEFKLDIKYNKPEPLDPIIGLFFSIANQVYFVVVTAWDKVADDIRIRQLVGDR